MITPAPLSEQELQGLLSLNSDYKQFYCLKHCAEQQCLYILKAADGSPLMLQDEPEEGDDESSVHVFVPIWSHQDLAKYYLEHSMADQQEQYEPTVIALDLFKDKWAPTLEANNIALALMPLKQDEDFSFVRATIFEHDDPAAYAAAEAAKADTQDRLDANKEGANNK